jgi:hypothetical protein
LLNDREYIRTTGGRVDTLVFIEVLFGFTEKRELGEVQPCGLQQTQLASAGDRFCAPLHLEFVKNPAVVPFDGIEGKE